MGLFTKQAPDTTGLLYLGQTARQFAAESKMFVIHFWARDFGSGRRAVVYSDYDLANRIEKDGWFIQAVPRWLNGDNIWAPIKSPSSVLRDEAMTHGLEWCTTAKWWRNVKTGALAGQNEAVKNEEVKEPKVTDDLVTYLSGRDDNNKE